jgi:very-short-patch-repair endonuclease
LCQPPPSTTTRGGLHHQFLPSGEGPRNRKRLLGEEVLSLSRDGFKPPIRLITMQPSPLTYSRAKHLRREMTRSERILWFVLRGKRLEGYKFYRQVPIGPYIADFVNHRHRLIIEVDGATHGEAHEIAHDAQRSAYLERQGYRVLRVMNVDVYQALDGVVEIILAALREP